jgi:hypothetical protein
MEPTLKKRQTGEKVMGMKNTLAYFDEMQGQNYIFCNFNVE